MPSERLAQCFSDVLTAIALIKTWVDDAGGAEQAIYHDLKVRSAIERQLLVISEAAIRIDKLDPAIATRLAPNIDWPGIRGMGNFIRHKYDDFDTTIVVDVLHNRLDELRHGCERALDQLAMKE